MKGTVREVEMSATEIIDDEPTEVYGGSFWEVTCPTHGETWDSEWEAQARMLARSTSTFCGACAEELRAKALSLPASDATEAAHLENYEMRREEQALREKEAA